MVSTSTPPPGVGPFYNVFVGNNYISSNSSTVDNVNTVTYNYFQGIVTYAYALIDGNLISGISSTTSSGSGTITNTTGQTIFVLFNGASVSKMINNILTRGSQSIDAYVFNNSDSGIPQVVVDNIFDSAFIDVAATNINLDAGTLVGSNYSRNINQTGSISISLMDYTKYIASGGTGSYSAHISPQYSSFATGPATIQTFEYSDDTVDDGDLGVGTMNVQRVASSGGLEGSDYTQVSVILFNTAPNAPKINFSATLPLDYLLPNDVKIVSATLGSWFNNQGIGGLVAEASLGATQEFNQISLSLIEYINTTNNTIINGTSNPNTVLDVANNIAIVSSVSSLDRASISSILRFTTIIYNDGVLGPEPTYQIITVGQIISSTQYCSIILGTPGFPSYGSLVAGAGSKMTLEVNLNFVVNSSGGRVTMSWYLSPIVVQYRW